MKTSAIIAVGFVASASAFAPVSQSRASTELSESLFDKIFGLDLFEPVKTQNDYGARKGKNVSSSNSLFGSLQIFFVSFHRISFLFVRSSILFATNSSSWVRSRPDRLTFLTA